MERITLATLNIAAASPERARRILDEWIIPSAFDVLVLTETSDGPGTDLMISEFKMANWSVFRRPTSPKDRGVTIVSRIRAIERHDYFSVDDPAPGRSIVLDLQSDPVIQLVGMYVPNRGNDQNKTARKFAFLDFWQRHLRDRASSAQRHRVLIGDLNVVPPTQQPRFLPQHRFEDDWYKSLVGVCDLYDAATAHNESGHETTWLANTGEGYTYDHILPQNKLSKRVAGFAYDHSTRGTGGITDHSALVLTLFLDDVTYIHRNPLTVQKQGSLF